MGVGAAASVPSNLRKPTRGGPFPADPSGLARSSLRSKASSASVSGGGSSREHQQKDRKKACKDCCRATVLFLFTQVQTSVLCKGSIE